MSGVVTLGETMALFTADAIGPLSRMQPFRLSIGGAESNVAIGLVRLGQRATWIGRVGADEFGELIVHELRAQGVEPCAIIDPVAPTGLMVKHARTAQHTRVAYRRAGSAGSRLSPADVDPDLVAGADLLHITGITPALSPSAAAAVEHAIAIAVEAGVPVSFDVNHRAALWRAGDAAAVYRSLAARATIVFAGRAEAALVTRGGSPDELAAGIAAMGPRHAVVKLGGAGCCALIEGERFAVDAVPITPLDTVGAGDAFVSGYLAELLTGSPPRRRLEVAVRAGAFACLGPGDWESFPARDELGLLDRDDPVSR